MAQANSRQEIIQQLKKLCPNQKQSWYNEQATKIYEQTGKHSH